MCALTSLLRRAPPGHPPEPAIPRPPLPFSLDLIDNGTYDEFGKYVSIRDRQRETKNYPKNRWYLLRERIARPGSKVRGGEDVKVGHGLQGRARNTSGPGDELVVDHRKVTTEGLENPQPSEGPLYQPLTEYRRQDEAKDDSFGVDTTENDKESSKPVNNDSPPLTIQTDVNTAEKDDDIYTKTPSHISGEFEHPNASIIDGKLTLTTEETEATAKTPSLMDYHKPGAVCPENRFPNSPEENQDVSIESSFKPKIITGAGYNTQPTSVDCTEATPCNNRTVMKPEMTLEAGPNHFISKGININPTESVQKLADTSLGVALRTLEPVTISLLRPCMVANHTSDNNQVVADAHEADEPIDLQRRRLICDPAERARLIELHYEAVEAKEARNKKWQDKKKNFKSWWMGCLAALAGIPHPMRPGWGIGYTGAW